MQKCFITLELNKMIKYIEKYFFLIKKIDHIL